MTVALIDCAGHARARQHALVAEAGSVQAISVAHDAAPGRVVWSILLAAGSNAGMPAWLLTSRHTPHALALPESLSGAANAALETGRIKVLRHHMAKPTPQQIRSVLDEFDCFSFPIGTLLMIDCADNWFGKPSRPGQALLIDALQDWAHRRQVAVVLLFHARTARNVDRATELLGFARHLSGIARIGRPASALIDAESDAAADLSCNLLFWFNRSAVVADAERVLRVAPNGMLQIDAAQPAADQQQAALDADVVIVQRSALAGSGGAPAHWILCDTVDDVLAAGVGAQAATVILTFERTTPHDHLMQAVYRLRRHSGSRLKIIVRELHVRLRYNEEALIARLGASLIVPMEVSYARFLSMMEMVQSQLFGAALPATYDEALADGLPQQEAGYLPPQAFARTVADILSRSRALAIDNVLVRLTLGGGLTPLDAMRHCTVKRAGDVFSCDRKTVVVFLFACREIDATQTLERIFALPVGELFSSEHRYISNLAATTAIEDFGQHAATGRLPDLSEELQQILALRQQGTGQSFAATMASAATSTDDAATSCSHAPSSPAQGPGTIAAVVPLRPAPVRTPLRMRAGDAAAIAPAATAATSATSATSATAATAAVEPLR